MKTKFMVAFLQIVLLTACISEQPTTNTYPTVPSLTSTITASPSLTKTPLPTQMPSPTFRPTNAIPAATLNAIGTTEALRIHIITQIPELDKYPASCHPTYCFGVEASPNGQWIYFSSDGVIEVFYANGTSVGKYTFPEISGRSDVVEGGLGAIHWSNDGRYLYLVTSFGDGGPGPYFGYKYSLARVNLQNGTWKDTGISGVLSFSPNDKYIVYSTNKSEIHVRNLESGEENTYTSSDYYLYFGDFVWSPDSKKVIFVSVPEQWDVTQGTFALFMVDLEKNTMTKVYENSLPFYYPVRWIEENEVLLKKDQGDEELTLDLSVSPPITHP